MAYLDEDQTPAWQEALIAVLSALYFIAALLWFALLALSKCAAPGLDGEMHLTSCALAHPWRLLLLGVAVFALFGGVFWLGRRNRVVGLTALVALVALACWPVASIFL